MKYLVRITETLAKDIVVEAADEDEAEDKAIALYEEGSIALDDGDYSDYDVDVEGETEDPCDFD